MSTPARGSSLLITYAAMAAATRRTFSKVKSSAIMPRQPSVPNLISVGMRIQQDNNNCGIAEVQNCGVDGACRRSNQVFALFLVQVLHHLADVLRALQCGDEQRVVGFHYHQVLHSYH